MLNPLKYFGNLLGQVEYLNAVHSESKACEFNPHTVVPVSIRQGSLASE